MTSEKSPAVPPKEPGVRTNDNSKEEDRRDIDQRSTSRIDDRTVEERRKEDRSGEVPGMGEDRAQVGPKEDNRQEAGRIDDTTRQRERGLGEENQRLVEGKPADSRRKPEDEKRFRPNVPQASTAPPREQYQTRSTQFQQGHHERNPWPWNSRRQEERRQEERRQDGRRQEDRRQEDRRPEGRRQEGRRQEDRRQEDRRQEDRRPEDRRQEDRRPEDRRPEDRRPEDRQQEDRRPEDRQQEDRRQEDRQQEDRRQEERRQEDRRQDRRRPPTDHDLRRPLTDQERIERLRRSEYDLKNQLQTASIRMKEMEHTNSELTTQLADSEQKLAEVRRELGASRAFVGTEDSGDAQVLIQKLKDINEGVDDMAFNFVQSLVPENVQVTHATLSAFIHALPANGKRFVPLANAALRIKAATAQDFLHPVIVFWFQYYVLAQHIFSPFVPGMPGEASEMVKRLYTFICQSEPQERSARWRAITYMSGYPDRNDAQLVSYLVDDFVSRLMEAIPPLFSQEKQGMRLPRADVLAGNVQQLVLDAIKWQDKAKSSYLSFDFEPFFVAAEDEFDPAAMMPSEPFTSNPPKGKKPEVLIGAGAGLRAWRNVVGENKKMEKQYKVSTKATVVCQNWLFSNTGTEHSTNPAT